MPSGDKVPPADKTKRPAAKKMAAQQVLEDAIDKRDAMEEELAKAVKRYAKASQAVGVAEAAAAREKASAAAAAARKKTINEKKAQVQPEAKKAAEPCSSEEDESSGSD